MDVEVEALNRWRLLKTDGQVSRSQSAAAAFPSRLVAVSASFSIKITYCKDSFFSLMTDLCQANFGSHRRDDERTTVLSSTVTTVEMN